MKYAHDDIVLLSKTDNLHEMRNGHAVKETLIREFRSGKEEYMNIMNIMNISVSHIYNMRKENVIYRASSNLFYTKTKSPKGVNIGKRKKPHPYGKPGFLRVDSVHQGDLGKLKGVYYINTVDEVTQWANIILGYLCVSCYE